MANGILRLRLMTGSALPVNNATVRIKTAAGPLIYEERIFVGQDGISRGFVLETPDLDLSLQSEQGAFPYALYNIEVVSADFQTSYINGVQVFPDNEAILQVEMQPLPEAFPPSQGPIYINIPPHALRLPAAPPPDLSILPPPRPTGQIHTSPYIPEFITVHLGVPNNTLARNVTVTFQDYIKNVASSEIYPTWPEESLRANILAQISLVLNRVYTEWYRSRGYDFDITNSTQYDQYFVEGRNFFESVSKIVDEIFNVYLKKPGREEPFYAEYCNGTTSTCPGMSQWGTVDLARQGYDALQILEYYYGDIETVEDNVLIGPFESYPGSPMSLGSAGDPVREMQQQLNRIAVNYPRIPLVAVDGVFGLSTQSAVRAFQEIFNLTPDGVVGKATWYAISRIYVAVKKLAELSSEGERVSYADQEYPGYVIRTGAQGSEVLEIQLYLSTIALYNNEVRSVEIDGVYGATTRDAVYSFQLAYGLSADGTVGPVTWYKLVDVYNGIKENVDVPLIGSTLGTLPYPGFDLSRGDSGEKVMYVQDILNAISRVFVDLPAVEKDGVFGEDLENAVKEFQELVGIEETGIVDVVTWNLLNDVFRREADNAIGDLGERPYPNTPVRQGDRGENVRYIIASLNLARRVFNSLPELVNDGVFGNATASAVREFQRLTGLDADGVVGPLTWEYLNLISTYAFGGCFDVSQFSENLSEGAQGEDVLRLQLKLLKMQNYIPQIPATLTPDARFGAVTKRAVEEFQRVTGLNVTGIVDSATGNRINEVYERICDVRSDEDRQEIFDFLGVSPVFAQYDVPAQTPPAPPRPTPPAPPRPTLPAPPRPTPPAPPRPTPPAPPRPTPPAPPRPTPPTPPRPTPPAPPRPTPPAPPRPTPPAPPRPTPPAPPRPTPPAPPRPTPPVTDRRARRVPFERPLRIGSAGEDVVRLKRELFEKGYLPASALDNNMYGLLTRRAVEGFQRDNGIDTTGRVDRTTHDALYN